MTDIMENAVLLTLKLSTITNSKKISSEYVNTEANKKLVQAKKKLMDAKELSAINSGDQKLRRRISDIGLHSYFKTGIYLIPVQQVTNVQTMLEEAKSLRARQIEELQEVWNIRLEEAQEELADLFNPLDYPAVEDLPSMFGISWQYIDVSVSNKLKSISAELFRQEQQKAKQTWDGILQEARIALRGEIAGLVDWWVERLKDTGDGKPKRIKPQSIKRLQEWIELFAEGGRDLTNDEEIQKHVNNIKKLFSGVDASLLNESETTRAIIHERIEEIQKEMVPLIENVPRRRISTTDDEL